MAHDHFQTPPDPKRGYKKSKKSEKSLKVRAKPAKRFGETREHCDVSLQTSENIANLWQRYNTHETQLQYVAIGI